MKKGVQIPKLQLSAKLGAWRMHDDEAEMHNDDYQRIRHQVLRRDQFTCQFCQFKSTSDQKAKKTTRLYSGFLECHHIDDNHANNVPENLITACPFCHQVFHTGNAGHRSAANIGLMPFLRQEDINILFNILAITKANDSSKYHDVVKNIEDIFTAALIAADDIEPGLSDAANFGSIYIGLSIKDVNAFQKIQKLTWAMRLIPDLNSGVFDRAVEYWASNNTWLPERQWTGVLDSYQKNLNKNLIK